jgi:hypothetical protein
MYRKQVTMIDDLMDLESQNPSQSYMNNQQPGIPIDPDITFTQKFIRTPSNGNGMGKLDEVNQQILPYQPKQQPNIQKQEIMEPQIDYKPYLQHQHRLHCVDVVNHIKDCPVCQKLYNNNEKNIYIMVIVILIIIIALLVKKLIEK